MLIKIFDSYVEHSAVLNVFPKDQREDSKIIYYAKVNVVMGKSYSAYYETYSTYKKRDEALKDIVDRVNAEYNKIKLMQWDQ